MTCRASKLRGGFTLIELMTSMIIFVMVSSAAFSLLQASMNVNRSVTANVQAITQTELAMRRLIENIRYSSTATVAGTTGITLVMPTDPASGVAPTIGYSYSAAAKTLTETHSVYSAAGTTLLSNISAFSITVNNYDADGTTPRKLTLSLTVNGAPQIVRTCVICRRN